MSAEKGHLYIAPSRNELRRNPARWEDTFSHLNPMLCRVGDRIVPGEGEDLAQEAWYGFVKHQGEIEKPGGYLTKSVVNKAFDSIKKEQGHNSKNIKVIFDSVLVDSAPDTGYNPQDRIHTADSVLDAVMSLSPRQKEAIYFRYYEELNEEEIAAKMGISKGTLKSHLHRAHRSLKQTLGKDFTE